MFRLCQQRVGLHTWRCAGAGAIVEAAHGSWLAAIQRCVEKSPFHSIQEWPGRRRCGALLPLPQESSLHPRPWHIFIVLCVSPLWQKKFPTIARHPSGIGKVFVVPPSGEVVVPPSEAAHRDEVLNGNEESTTQSTAAITAASASGSGDRGPAALPRARARAIKAVEITSLHQEASAASSGLVATNGTTVNSGGALPHLPHHSSANPTTCTCPVRARARARRARACKLSGDREWQLPSVSARARASKGNPLSVHAWPVPFHDCCAPHLTLPYLTLSAGVSGG